MNTGGLEIVMVENGRIVPPGANHHAGMEGDQMIKIE